MADSVRSHSTANDGRERDYKSRKEQERSRDKERSEARKNKRREW